MALATCLLVGWLLAASPLLAQSPAAPAWPGAVELEHFLAQAKVLERTKLDSGITESLRVTLELDGVERRAIFKHVDSPHDSWRREVAAYEFDKLLGLAMVPPTVEREIRGRRGCLQQWVEGVAFAALQQSPPDLESWRRQVSIMWLFDDLIANTDRHLNNALVSPEYRLVLIDNSRAFKTNRALLHDLNRAGSATRSRYWMVEFESERHHFPTTYPRRLIERLKSLTDREIKASIGRYIGGYERDRLLQRRAAVLQRIEHIQGVQP